MQPCGATMTSGLTPDRCEAEKNRIIAFLRRHLDPDGRAVIGLSGGIDADNRTEWDLGFFLSL